MEKTVCDVALLAPVPLVHLESGLAVCQAKGKVAFGSKEWKAFHKLNIISADRPVDVYIYASWAGIKEVWAATWHGIYIGYVESVGGVHPDGLEFRPDSTQSDTDDSAVFWEIKDLRRLTEAKHIPLTDFVGYDKKVTYKKNFKPERPLLVEHP